ncbi:1-(5-phosphoribosyl)-5-[(5-phosphoribosylamino)methylideneamino]imidazole-4-carboxamide isomerase [Flocculibacter collagenilyticus]|uniref:1-(5-phosphoribosyl)-5-[(5- phosphoribosylamino)methylideneamino]imidazole-4- carboxamide isomerase n=1 Tax=Flocculibacter collagenilyticus TaxID=2744479 RepID=UPI0018F5DABB|nr:1-(5-phosphoribosyl)-5-[(5-phosphoribosylamino)methylideneamino]imidazole-4-carboxamide isomerase [Flocculibacter collagenilyticus]
MIIPALDLINGSVVRLYQGDYKKKTEYAYSAVEKQQRYANEGAQVLHIVDLDGAKDSKKRQLQLIKNMIKQANMITQIGGGIRSESDIENLLDLGANRVVIGSLAIQSPELVASWIEKYGNDAIVLALDVNIDKFGNKQLPTHGWLKSSGITLEALLEKYANVNVKHVLCTDISKDGTLKGANVALYQELCANYPDIQWQASGGIGRLSDIIALKPTGVSGVILGRALLEGKFTVEEAISCWQNA